jgi:abortive infection bacteriophage resistance protein
MRTTAGCLFMRKEKYRKPRLSIDEQIQLLAEQGLKIESLQDAQHVIKVVGYYRFSGYLHPFKSPHQNNSRRNFQCGITFDTIWQLYQFDRELRLLVSDAIEKIEVAFRASISDVTSKELGLFWYADSKFCRNQSLHLNFMRKIDSQLKHPEEVFIQHYLEKYNDPKFPPVWMMIESLSFGTCSKLFSNIQSIAIRNMISEIFQQHTTIIESWMKVIVSVRNICAHHSRLWNRWLVEAPIVPKNEPLHGYLLNHNRKFIVCAYILTKLLQPVAPQNHWKNNLYDLFDKYNQFPGLTMGFSKEWQKDPFWEL